MNTYTGTAAVNAGTLNVGGGTGTGAIPNSPITVASGALLKYQKNIGFTANPLTVTGNLDYTSTGILGLPAGTYGANTLTGNGSWVDIQGNLIINAGAGGVTITGNSASAGIYSAAARNITTTGNVTFVGTNTGGGFIAGVATGGTYTTSGGTLTFDGTHSGYGVEAGVSGSYGSSYVLNGNMIVKGTGGATRNSDIAASVSGQGNITFIGRNKGLNTNNNFTASGGALNVTLQTTANGMNGILNSGTDSTLNGNYTINSATNVNFGARTINAGTGAISLTSATGYSLTGATALNANTIAITDSNAIALAANTLTIGNISTSSISNVISGTGGLTKTAAGALILTGTNTYTGATTISAGILGGTGSSASSAHTVGAAGTIMGGTGAGNSGTYTTGALTFTSSASKLQVNTNGTNAVSKISAGAVILAGVTVDVLGAINTGGTYDIIMGSSVSGTAVLGTNNSGCGLTLVTTVTKLQLVADCSFSATINQTVGQGDPTANNPINFTVVFSKAIAPATFVASDVTLTGTGIGTVGTPTTADNITWIVPVTGTATGTIIADLSANKVTDAQGNSNTAATSTDHTVTYANAGFTLSTTTLSFVENAGTGTFTVALSTQPVANVVFTITSGSTTNVTVAPSTLTFTNGNWNVPQTVTATGVRNTASLINNLTNITVAVNTGISDASYASVASKIVLATTTDVDDTDHDGTANTLENAGFNGGDGNGDGIQDSIQASVAGTPNTLAGGAYTTLQASGGCNIVNAFSVVSEASRPTQDSTSDFPLGLNDFTLGCGSAGQSGTITIFYDHVYDTSAWSWKKYNATNNTYTDVTSIASTSITSQSVGGAPVTKVTFTVTDGGVGDQDGIANGIIVDPIGPAVPAILAVAASSGGGNGPIVGSWNNISFTNSVAPTASTISAVANTPYAMATSTRNACTKLLGITHIIKLKGANNSDEVKKLESFLNLTQGESLKVNGVYKSSDVAAVNRFQKKYAKEILTVQAIKNPTGIWGLFTNKKAQELSGCK